MRSRTLLLLIAVSGVAIAGCSDSGSDGPRWPDVYMPADTGPGDTGNEPADTGNEPSDTGNDPGDTGTDPGDTGNEPKEVVTSIFGVVIDEGGSPVKGATIKAHGQSKTTSADGTFKFDSLTVPEERCVVIATKPGMLLAAQSAVPVKDGLTSLQLRLLLPEQFLVDGTGGEIALDTGATVQFPAQSFAKNGLSFGEPVTALARHIGPDRVDYASLFPGGPDARRTDGSDTTLLSVGVITVELVDAVGEPVQLAAGKTATLKFPVPASMSALLREGESPVETIPLWFFSEEQGLWIEEGLATYSEADQMYVGTVRHFTPWNLDIPGQRAYVRGRVACSEDGAGIPNLNLVFGEFTGRTQADGTFLVRIPNDYPIDIYAHDPAVPVADWTTSLHHLDGLAPEATEDVGTLVLPLCPVAVTGTLVDCAGAPISGSVTAGIIGAIKSIYVGADGAFSFLAAPSTSFILTGLASSGLVTPTTGSVDLTPLALGNVTACTATLGCATRDLPSTLEELANIDSAFALSPDGMRAAFAGLDGDYHAYCYLIDTLEPFEVTSLGECPLGHRLAFSANGNYLVAFDHSDLGSGITLFDLANQGLAISIPEIGSPHFLGNGSRIVAMESIQQSQGADGYTIKLQVLSSSTGEVLQNLEFWPEDFTDGATHVFDIYNSSLVGTRGEAALLMVTLTDAAAPYEQIYYLAWVSTSLGLITQKVEVPSGFISTEANLVADGTLLWAMSSKEQRLLFNTTTGAEVTLPMPNDFGAASLAYLPTRGSFVLSTYGEEASLYEVSLTGVVGRHELPDTAGEFSLAVSGDGQTMAAFGRNAFFIRLWDLTVCEATPEP